MSGASRSDDFYLLLGVPPSATEDEIYDAYRDRCFLLHPDRLAGAPPGARQRAEQDIRRLNRAWEVLGDPVSRAAHDAWYVSRSTPTISAPITLAVEPLPRPSRAIPCWPVIIGVAAVLAFVLGAGSVALLRGARGRGAPVARADVAVTPAPQATTVAAPTPLVADGGFELDPGSWTLEAGVQRVAGEGRHRSTGLRLPGDGSWNNAYRTIMLPEPACYQLAAWVRGEGAARLDLLTAEWGPVASVRLGRAADWTLQGGTVVTDRTGPLLLALRDSESGPYLLIDDVSVRPCMRE